MRRPSVPSLKRRLLVALMITLPAAWVVSAMINYRAAHQAVNELFDTEQAFFAQLLASVNLDARGQGYEIRSTLPRQLHELFDDGSDEMDEDIAFQLRNDHNQIVFADINQTELPFDANASGFRNVMFQGKQWRLFYLRDPKNDTYVVVGQRLKTRDRLVGRLVLGQMMPWLMALPVLLVLMWLAVRRSLLPLDRLVRDLRERAPDNLKPIEAPVPAEVGPLVVALNRLFARLDTTLTNERRFTADAAHELRTPLAALRVQAEVAMLASDDTARRKALVQVMTGIDRATRLVEQLLALARQEGAGEGAELVSLDLTALARNALADAEPEAARHAIALTLDAPTAHVVLRADEAALAVLLRNLLGNALRHTPPGGQVRVGVREEASVIDLTVEDSGPGIAPDERARVQGRFYRVPGTPGHGSGLGLAIVRAIAERHGAALTLDASPTLGGLRVMLRWPAV